MTDQFSPAQFDWATELSDVQGHVTLSEQEAHEIGARLRRLQAGYAAARLEIESLQARIKTMAEEHADELMVAHLDGRMRAAQQPSPTPQADSQPAPVRDERDDFEKVFTLPSGCIRVGTGYASTGYCNRAAHTHCERWQGWQARAARAPADSVPAPWGGADWQDISTAPKDGTRFVAVGQNYGLDSEAQHTCIAQWLAGCWVEVSDWNGASKLKYLTHWMPLPPLPCSAARAPADSVTAPATTCPTCKAPCTTTVNMRGGEHGWGTTDLERTEYHYAPAQAADSVLEDAARYRWLRINAIGAFRTNDGTGPVSVYHLSKIPAIPGIPEETDAAIDAARKQGANHD